MGARILVVGGAGYIGSICGARLARAGHHVHTLDNLSAGHASAVHGPLHRADIRDEVAVTALIASLNIDLVMHFAGRIQVGESIRDPLGYANVNIGGSLSLLRAMHSSGVRRVVFSSSCAVYGSPVRLPMAEGHPCAPVSPYGDTKLAIDALLRATRAAGQLDATNLRYFNAAGASDDGLRGESHHPETHLIPLAIEAATGKRGALHLFGTQHPTPDGTCIRDYVHVEDLAEAHVLAAEAMLDGERGADFNVGTGVGHSVREVIAAVGQALGKPVPVTDTRARPGDAPCLVADASKIQRELGWQPTRSSLQSIVTSAARWSDRRRY